MSKIKLSEKDIIFLKKNYPTLTYDKNSNLIIGQLQFHLNYEKSNETIRDSYEIEIDLNNVFESCLPKVRETAGRILSIAQKKNLFFGDLHLNSLDGEMCTIIPAKAKEKYPHGFDLSKLLMHVQEHLYWVSYYEKHDKKPWKEYGHGEKGYLELYIEDGETYSEDIMDYFGVTKKSDLFPIIEKLKEKYKI